MDKMYIIFSISLMIFSIVHKSACQQNLDPNGPLVSAAQVANNQGTGLNQQQAPIVDPEGTTTTTASPAFRACVENCRTVQNYNPVCGSDGVTYNNQFRLECARRCGLQIQMVRGGACVSL